MPTKAPESFIDAEVQAGQMIADYAQQVAVIDAATARIKAAADELLRMTLPAPQGYKSLGDYLTAQAAANPADPVWLGLAGRMAAARTDFEAKCAEVSILVAAIEG